MEKKVTITIKTPVECTEQQFEEWIKFCVGYTASMSCENPLCDYELEAKDVKIES